MDYLVIGNITKDKIDTGYQIGGTASFAALTANALGLQTSILSAAESGSLDLSQFNNIPVYFTPCAQNTIFENKYNGKFREQIIHQWAGTISLQNLPNHCFAPKIVHFGPVATEIDPEWVVHFPESYKGITIQGLMRKWDDQGKVSRAPFILPASQCNRFDAIIFSIEDVCEDENIIETYAHNSAVLAVTEGKKGVRIYWHGDMRHISAPFVNEISDTGAGDIFASAFFIRHQQTKNPWEAARFATQIAANSVTRIGLDGIPTEDEIKKLTIEIL
ncbi:MAG: hypothetical protein JEZ00_03600 [Anaerolineaceae bacterium]|nr:hypothetical protein [Anaerolineaceae bacterium]